MNIELDHVAPPYLHILLGITKKHHDLLEDECHSLDKLIGQSLASSGKEIPESSAAFHTFVVKSKDILDQEEKKRKRLNSFSLNQMMKCHLPTSSNCVVTYKRESLKKKTKLKY